MFSSSHTEAWQSSQRLLKPCRDVKYASGQSAAFWSSYVPSPVHCAEVQTAMLEQDVISVMNGSGLRHSSQMVACNARLGTTLEQQHFVCGRLLA